MENNSQVALKLTFKEVTRRIQVDLCTFRFQVLEEYVNEFFTPLPHHWQVAYFDDEKDCISVTNDIEMMEACRVFLKLMENNETRVIHFHILSKMTIKDHMEPLLLAVKELSTTMSRFAVATKEKIIQTSSATPSKQVLTRMKVDLCEKLKNVQRRMSVDMDGFKQRASSFSKRFSLSEEQTEAGNVDDDGVHEQEVQQQVEQADTEVVITQEEVVHCDNHVESTGSENGETETDWDVIPSIDENESEEFEAQLKTILSIVPQVNITKCMDLLTKHKGDIETVLVELTDF